MRCYTSILLLMMCCLAFASGEKGFLWEQQLPLKNNEANALFESQNFDEALKSYLDLYGQDTGNGALAYNIGNTYAALGDMEKAREFYDKAARSRHDAARDRARFNLGNLDMANQQAGEAVKRYVDYLKSQPDDLDAKRNLELALKMLEQQQQQQQQQQDQQQNDDQQQNEDQQQQQQQHSQGEENEEDQQQQQQQQENDDQQDQQQNQDQQDQQNQDQQDQQQQQSQNEEQQQQQQQAQPKEEDKLNESMKEQIMEALREQEAKQQKEYQKRKIGKKKRRAKDW